METSDITDEPDATPADDSMEGEAAAAPATPEEMTPGERANLAAAMDEEEQKKIVGKCLDRYERDQASCSERMKHLKNIQEMYALVPKTKNFPFHKAANIKTPTLTAPILQIGARLFDMMWPITGKVFNVIAGTSDETKVAGITENFGNSYVRYNIPYMSQGLHDTIHQMAAYGSAFRRVYWDEYQRKVRCDWVPMDDFVVAYKCRSQDPSMSDVPRYTMVHHMTSYDLNNYGDAGVYINADKAKGLGDSDASEFKQTADKIDGQTVDEDDEEMPRPVLEQHCRWKLPNKPGKHPAFDGKEHYVVITIDAWSRQLLRFSLREEDDPDDRRRFEREQQAFQKWQLDMATFIAGQEAGPQSAPMPAGFPSNGNQLPTAGPPPALPPSPGQVGPLGAPVAPGGASPPPAAPLGPGGPPMPMSPPRPLTPPLPVPEPKPIRKRQICFFTHYRCFPSDGFYGLGYGDLLYGLSVGSNTILNQHIDGMTLKNAKPMFMSRQVRMQRGAVNIQPGEVVEIDGPVNQIRDAIMFLDPPDNDPTTVSLVKLLDGMKDQMAGSSDMMSGQIPGSNQTKGGLQILNEQMMTPITVLARTTRESFQHELTKIWRCFGVFLEDDDIASVVAEGNVAQEMPIGKYMFTPSARLVPAADPRMKSARLDDHQQLFGYCLNNPILKMNPQVGIAIMTKLTEEGFRIFPDGEALIPLLQPPPQQPPPPPQPMPQWAENAGFLRGQYHPVLPTDDHDQHIQELALFMQGADGQVMDKPGRDMAEKHMRDHVAARLEAHAQMMMGGGGPPGGPPMMNGGPPNVPPGPHGPPPGPPGGGPPPMAGPGNFQAPPGPPPPGAPPGA